MRKLPFRPIPVIIIDLMGAVKTATDSSEPVQNVPTRDLARLDMLATALFNRRNETNNGVPVESGPDSFREISQQLITISNSLPDQHGIVADIQRYSAELREALATSA